MANSAHAPPPARGIRIPLAAALIGGVVLLILLGVGGALWSTLSSARINTLSLLGHRASMTFDLLQARIDGELGPVVNAGVDLAAQFADGRLDLGDRRQRTFDTLSGALAALPQATGVVLLGADQQSIMVVREDGSTTEVTPAPAVRRQQELALSLAGQTREPFWAPPLWVPALHQPILTHLVPVWRGNEFLGVTVVSITLDKISRFLETLEETGDLSAFILYGGNHILAHPRLDEAGFERSESLSGNPLPTIDALADPAFELLDGGGARATQLLEYASDLRDARVGEDIIVLTRDSARYGDIVWTLGVTLQRATATQEINRLRDSAIVGAAILVIAVVGGFLFARTLNRQIGRLVGATATLARLDIGSTPRIPDSRISELSRAARAFNALTNTLHWFEIYVPKQLVLRLMQGSDDHVRAEARELSVMFTDIRGFSTIAEHMDAVSIATLLNDHFAMLADAIEAEGGTVDKFIGDAIMAFWGAPEQMDDHADRALRAAAEIQRRVRADNTERRATGRAPLRVRLGLHAGPVIVGNIGSHARVNYTIVGDTVNTASRIDSLAKEMPDNDDCVVLVSDDIRAGATDRTSAGYVLKPLGEHDIRGREGTVLIYRLEAENPACGD